MEVVSRRARAAVSDLMVANLNGGGGVLWVDRYIQDNSMKQEAEKNNAV